VPSLARLAPSAAPLLGDFEANLGDLLHDAHAVSPYEAAVHASLADRVERVLACLAPREATVLRLRFGLGVRQIEAKALGKLRKRSPELAALLDGRERGA
jgi:RNA polymerase primary sigma factor